MYLRGHWNIFVYLNCLFTLLSVYNCIGFVCVCVFAKQFSYLFSSKKPFRCNSVVICVTITIAPSQNMFSSNNLDKESWIRFWFFINEWDVDGIWGIWWCWSTWGRGVLMVLMGTEARLPCYLHGERDEFNLHVFVNHGELSCQITLVHLYGRLYRYH